MIQAITEALEQEWKRDQDILVFLEKIVGKMAEYSVQLWQVFLRKKNFRRRRVFRYTLAESGIGGMAIGLAFTGLFVQFQKFNLLGFIFWSIRLHAGQSCTDTLNRMSKVP